MNGVRPFEENADKYDAWFNKHPLAYHAELRAIRKMMPKKGKGLEVGVGTGRFSGPLGIKTGVEPSEKMGQMARLRGIDVTEGVAEELPFEDDTFDFVLMVTTICFVNDVVRSFEEAGRVLKDGGFLIVGFVDKESPLGERYHDNRQKSEFYRHATFFSVDEVLSHLKDAGFRDPRCVQTIFGHLKEVEEECPVKEGTGEGSFVVVQARKTWG